MGRISEMVVVVLVCSAGASAQTAGPTGESGGSVPKIKLRMLDTVTSAHARVGQAVQLEAVNSLQIDGKVAVASGSHARGVVTEVRHRGHNRREGKLVLLVQSVMGVDGRELPLQSASVRQGGSPTEPIFGPCTFPIPADPVGLFRRGHDVVIPKGTELEASLDPPR